MLNICLVGSGGVGTIASLVLEKSRRAKVTSVLRSNFAVVNEKGFDIESVDHGKLDGWKPTRIVSSISEAAKHGPYDFIIITTKSLPDMTSLPDLIRPIVTKYTTGIVLLQSGLDIEIPIIEAFPKCLVMSGVSMIGVRIRENEVVQEEADVVVFGPHIHPGLGERLQREKAHLFVEIYTSGSCKKCTYTPTILQTRWLSLLHQTPLSILCTLTRLDIGSLLRGGGTSTLLKPAMLEMQMLAKAAGYEVADGFLDETLKGIGTESSIKPSMLVDLEMGRPLELEVVLGVPLRYARELSVECPVLRMVYDLLRLTEFGVLQNGLQRRITAE